ncbi:MAG: twin-arginine translocase TatA/TatE family subunit [Terracidiphilus sp.]
MGTPPPIHLDTFSMPDTLILMVLALVVLGPRRLPELGRQIGKLMYEFRKASNDFKFQMEEELRQAEEADRRKKEEAERQRALAAAPPPLQIEAPAETQAESPVQPAESAAPASPAESTAAIQPATAEPTASAVSAPVVESPLKSAPAEPSEPAAPRILPPSTGEKVAADRPGTQPAQQELFAHTPDEAGTAPESVAPETERSEPAAHHG